MHYLRTVHLAIASYLPPLVLDPAGGLPAAMDVHAAIQLNAIVVQGQEALLASRCEQWHRRRKSQCLILRMQSTHVEACWHAKRPPAVKDFSQMFSCTSL